MAEAKKIKQPKSKKKRGFFSYLIFFTTSFLLFLILLVSVTQTSVFKNWVKDFAVNKFNEQFGIKGAGLTVGSIEGNIFSEIIINNALLTVKNDETVKFDKLKITYNIFKLLDNVAEINELVLINPSVNFVKITSPTGDSVWNIAYIFETEEKEAEEPSEFNWKIIVQRLKIENLNFVMLAAKTEDIPVQALQIKTENSFNPDNLYISNFNIETRLQYDKTTTQLWINFLGFRSNFGFEMKGLSGDFYISESRAEINNFNIETSKSWVQMQYVFIDKLDLMKVEGLPSFKGKDLRMNLVAKNFDFDDLKAFLPAVDFLDKDVYLELKCKGKFDDILIEKCALKTANSDLNFSGRMLNLVDPERLWFDVAASNIRLDPKDTKIYTPGLPIPDYSHTGALTGSLTYRGEPLDFYTTFDLNSSIGSVKGNHSMNLNTSAISYKSYVEARNVNIGRLLGDPSLESDITGKIEVDGRGFDLASISTSVKYDILNTKIYGQNIDKSSGMINLRGYNIETEVNYTSGKFAADVKGNINVRDFNNPVYNMKGRVMNLDISHFTKNNDDKSSLTFAFDINGKGLSPENLEGTYNINLASSFYGTYDLPATPIDLKISTGGTSDIISLTSGLIDFKATGKFKIEQVGEVILSNIMMIQNEISKKFNLDTLLPVQKTQITGSEMDFVYEMRTKDPDAVSRILFLSDLNFAGDVKGHIKNTQSGFSGKSDVNIKTFSYRDTVFALRNASAELIHDNNYSSYKFNPKGDFTSFNSVINFKADTLRMSSNIYDSVKALIGFKDGSQFMNIYGKMDSTIKISFAGNVDLSTDSVVMSLSDLYAAYNKYEIKNENNLVISYYPYDKNKRINFDEFNLSGNLMKLNFTGYYSFNDTSDITVESKNISLPALMGLLNEQPGSPENAEDKSPFKGSIRRVLLNFKGNTEDPLLSLTLNTGTIRYDQVKVGQINAFIDYGNSNLSTEFLVFNAQGQGSLRLTGNIPFNNPLATPDSAEYAEMLTKPLQLNLKADNFQINMLSKLIPNFSDIRGFLHGQIDAGGTITEPVLSGNASIERGRVFFAWNGLYYRFESKLRAEESNLIVDEFKVYNDRAKDRFINIWGNINFAGMGINEIDLQAAGDMYFLDGSSIQNRFGFSGEMLAGSGDPPIRIKGSLNNLLVSGQFLIKKAKLYFPSIQGLAYDVYADDFTYRIITDDNNNKYLDTLIKASKEELDKIDPFLRYNYELSLREPSVADFITYDLEIVTQKNIYVNMIMNPLTREELFGEITGHLQMDNKTVDKRFQMFGNMYIVGDSYYRYYKNFRIKDSKIEFDGDYMDPLINLFAEYKNILTTEEGNEITYVILEISGRKSRPILTLKLRDEGGAEIKGPETQSNALSYLIFGRPLNDVRASSGKNIFSNLGENIGVGIANSLLYQAFREIAPFILNTEVIYTGGDIKGTDIKITSGFGDAIVKFGGKIFSNINNYEISIEYPLNKLFNINVSNNLLLEISRELSTSKFNYNEDFESRVGITYKIKY